MFFYIEISVARKAICYGVHCVDKVEDWLYLTEEVFH